MGSPEVVIVGGGLVGCLCALRLRDAGARVVVIEKGVPGAEASSAAAGILAAQSESREPGLMFDLALASRALYAALANELHARIGVDIGYRRCGVLDASDRPADLEAREAGVAWQRAAGHRVTRLDATAVRDRVPALGKQICGAIEFPDDGQVDPAKLAPAVAQCADRAGVEFKTGAMVRRVRAVDGRACGVELEDGFVAADHVVIAAGAWSSLVEGAQLARGSVRPARGQIVELRARTPPVASVLLYAGHYVVPRTDGRILCGSTLEFVGFRKEVTALAVMEILGVAIGLVPSLATATLERAWSNFRPYTPDEMPIIGGAGVEGLTVATGHYRSGILMAPITAELVRDRVLGVASRFDLRALSPSRPRLDVPEPAT